MTSVTGISPKYFLSILAALAYILFCLVVDVQKGVSFYQTTAKMHNNSNEKSEITLKSTQSISTEEGYISIKNQIVVVDTVIYKIERNKERSFLVGRVICDNSNQIIVKLSLTEEEAEEFASIVFKQVKLRAEINRIKAYPFEREIYTFENELVWHQLNNDYLLEGSLKDVLSVHSISS